MRRQAGKLIARLAKASEACNEASAASRQLSRSVTTAVPTVSSSLAIRGPAFRTAAFAASGVVQQSQQRMMSSSAADESWNTILYPESELEIGSPAPDFSGQAVVDGEIKEIQLSDYKGKYVVFFWYPKDFTFVCPTEIIAFSDRAKEFEALNCQLIAASTDTPETHLAWIRTPRKKGGLGFMQIPLLADVTKEVAARYGVLKKDAGIALRGLYIINPEGIVEHATINNFPIGRNVDEALRTLQAVQYVAEHGEVCPAGWQPGDKTMVADPDKSLDYFQSQEEAGEASKSTAFTPVSDRKAFDAATSSGKTVVKFWAPWCGKCRQIAPFADELAGKYGSMKFASVDTTEEKIEALAADLGVKALPAFRFFKDGKEVIEPVLGYKKQPLEQAVAELEKM